MKGQLAGAPVIPRIYWYVAFGMIAVAALILLWMGRPPICTCGAVKLWVGTVNGPDNSQHIADWYTPSHIIHGFLFYGMGWLFLRSYPAGHRLLAAVAIEAGWEILENSHYVIDRYRDATMALGYSGDSVLNSVADVGWMVLGFAIARRIPLWATIAIALLFELITLYSIRDNLTLNIVMLLWPIDSIRMWQGGA